MERIQITVSSVVPGVDDPADACCARFERFVRAREGVNKVHVTAGDDGSPGRFCIHFDPAVISLSEVREFARRTGAKLDQRYGHWNARIESMAARRASAITSRLSRIDGVLEAVVTADGAVRVEYDRERACEADISDVLEKWSLQDIDAHPVPGETAGDDRAGHERHHDHGHPHGHGHHHGGIFGPQSEMIFAILCGVFLSVGWLTATFTELSGWISLGCYLAAYLFGGYYTTSEAFEKLRVGKFEIDFLMIVAAAGAASLGVWAEGALLLFLFSIGHSLESYAMGRAKRAIEALSKIAPSIARVRRDAKVAEVSVDALVVGDIVVVHPDERIAADGFVVNGETSVDQAPITGESVPVDKHPVVDVSAAAADPESLSAEHRVFAGTINQSGAIEIQVTKRAVDNTLARVVTMVREAETRVSPTQKFAVKFERYFVPTVITIVILLMFAPLVIDEPLGDSFYRAMAVLVAASPCALAIATPSAVLSGIARAARGGVLVKGGGPLESLARLDSIAFDKTGTLTIGQPRITDIQTAAGVDEPELLRVAMAVESLSKHPLARAVVRDAAARLDAIASGAANDPLPVTELTSLTGRGLRAVVQDELVYVGNARLFAEVEGPAMTPEIRSLDESMQREGRTTMIVRAGDRYLGVIGLMDTPRESAAPAIAKLRQLGITQMVMISGDNQRVADAVAREVGLDEARGGLMPADKVNEIQKLRRGGGVAMVGDGVNDAPAMAAASVGIAMGAAGSDVALETADVALMTDDLGRLSFAIGLSGATRRIIRQNLWMSLGMVVCLVPATILGLEIGPAVAFHEGSTLVVIVNALRLLAYQE